MTHHLHPPRCPSKPSSRRHQGLVVSPASQPQGDHAPRSQVTCDSPSNPAHHARPLVSADTPTRVRTKHPPSQVLAAASQCTYHTCTACHCCTGTVVYGSHVVQVDERASSGERDSLREAMLVKRSTRALPLAELVVVRCLTHSEHVYACWAAGHVGEAPWAGPLVKNARERLHDGGGGVVRGVHGSDVRHCTGRWPHWPACRLRCPTSCGKFVPHAPATESM
jgi:hypothetical protein